MNLMEIQIDEANTKDKKDQDEAKKLTEKMNQMTQQINKLK